MFAGEISRLVGRRREGHHAGGQALRGLWHRVSAGKLVLGRKQISAF